MTSLYIEPEKFEEFALFEKELSHWNNIIKSGIELKINISEDELNSRLIDDFDPIGIVYQSSATMQLPSADKEYINSVKADLNKTIEKPRAIYILDVAEDLAVDKQLGLGVALYACTDVPKKAFAKTYFKEVSKNETINDGWKTMIDFDRPLSNSLIIADNFFLTNEDRNINRGLANLVPFLDGYLPTVLKTDYHVTIISQNIRLGRHKSQEWWNKEYGKIVAAVKLLREYPIVVEFVLAKSEVHKRRIISNYSISKADKGFDLFQSNDLKKIKEENDFEYLEIFSNLDNSGTKHFESIDKLLNQLGKHCSQISAYVAVKNNQLDRCLFGCNPDKTIKNRLLN